LLSNFWKIFGHFHAEHRHINNIHKLIICLTNLSLLCMCMGGHVFSIYMHIKIASTNRKRHRKQKKFQRYQKPGRQEQCMGARNRVGTELSYRPASLCSLRPYFRIDMGARNQVEIGLSYRPARLHWLAKSIPWLLKS
jgi:hypothetical protein